MCLHLTLCYYASIDSIYITESIFLDPIICPFFWSNYIAEGYFLVSFNLVYFHWCNSWKQSFNPFYIRPSVCLSVHCCIFRPVNSHCTACLPVKIWFLPVFPHFVSFWIKKEFIQVFNWFKLATGLNGNCQLWTKWREKLQCVATFSHINYKNNSCVIFYFNKISRMFITSRINTIKS